MAAAACGIETLAGTGMPYAELQRRVAGLWSLLLPSLVPEGAEANYRAGMPGTVPLSRPADDPADAPLDALGAPVPAGVTGSTG